MLQVKKWAFDPPNHARSGFSGQKPIFWSAAPVGKKNGEKFCSFIRSLVRLSPPQLALRFLQLALRPLQLTLRPLQLASRPVWLSSIPLQLTLKPLWLGLKPHLLRISPHSTGGILQQAQTPFAGHQTSPARPQTLPKGWSSDPSSLPSVL